MSHEGERPQGMESRREPDPTDPPATTRPAGNKLIPLWGRVALAVAVLGASGAGRQWQAWRVDEEMRQGRKSPIELAKVPLELGDWVGADEPLDPAIARNTGCTDYAFRTYTHRRTGNKLSLILLYGPSTDVYIHSPENCYPAAGYEAIDGPDPRAVAAAGGEFPFLTTLFAKGEGGQADRQEVYCTWQYAGRWTPVLAQQKQFERIPGMFKVHVARRVKENERRDVGNPCEAFLALLMADLDARLQAASAVAAR